MPINNINNSVSINQNNRIKQEDVKNKDNRKNKEEKLQIIKDKFEKSETPVVKPTYEKPVTKRDMETIEKIKVEVDQIHQNLRNLVEKLLKKQGMTFNDLKVGGQDIEIDDETRAEAKKATDEGGELSIESVSDRLVDFAKAISGGDKSKIKLLRESIEEGFRRAEEAFGGTLPEISHKTLTRTMEKLDIWEAE